MQIRQAFDLAFGDARATLTLIARNVLFTAAKIVDGQLAMVGTALTGDRLCAVGKFRNLRRGQKRGAPTALILRVKCRALGTHQPCDGRTDNGAPDLPFKAAEHRIV